MPYVSTWIDPRTSRVVASQEFDELDGALEDASTLWAGPFPLRNTVTNEDGVVVDGG